MASVQTIAKAQLTGAALEKVFGEVPSYIYEPDHVRVYYEPDRLFRVQEKVKTMATSGPSDVRIDWIPIVTPFAINKGLPYAIGIVAAGFFLGRLSKR